jgi:hypothetical protein
MTKLVNATVSILGEILQALARLLITLWLKRVVAFGSKCPNEKW